MRVLCLILCLTVVKASVPGFGGHYGEEDNSYHHHVQYQNLGSFVGKHHLPPKEIKVTKTVAVKVPVPFPVKIPHSIPYPVPVVKTVPVPVTKIVKVQEQVPVHVPTPVKVFVDKSDNHGQYKDSGAAASSGHFDQIHDYKLQHFKESGRHTSPVFDISAFHPSVLSGTKINIDHHQEHQVQQPQQAHSFEGHQLGLGGSEGHQLGLGGSEGHQLGLGGSEGHQLGLGGSEGHQLGLGGSEGHQLGLGGSEGHQLGFGGSSGGHEQLQDLGHQSHGQQEQQYQFVEQSGGDDHGKEQDFGKIQQNQQHELDQSQSTDVGQYQETHGQLEQYQHQGQPSFEHYQPQHIQVEQKQPNLHVHVPQQHHSAAPPPMIYQYFMLGSPVHQSHFEVQKPQAHHFHQEALNHAFLQPQQHFPQFQQHDFQPQSDFHQNDFVKNDFQQNVGSTVLKEVDAPQFGHPKLEDYHHLFSGGQGEGLGHHFPQKRQDASGQQTEQKN